MTTRKLFFSLSLACGIASSAAAATPVPHAFTAGAPARAADVNANFQSVVDQISAAIPTGTVLPFAGTTAPPGFLLCDGAAVSRVDYAALFSVISIGFGGGDGVHTFNLPDLRSRLLVGAGQGTGLTSRALGATGGEEVHALTDAEMASHVHTATSTQAAHRHRVQSSNGVTPVLLSAATGFAAWNNGATGFTDGPGAHLVELTTPVVQTTVDAAGSGTAHNNMPPFLALTWIIKI
jgi:microcystin-dependent protein